LPRIVGLSAEEVSRLGHEILRRFEQRAALFDLAGSTPELFLTTAFRANEELSRRLEELEIQERIRLNAQSKLGLREQELDRAKRLEAVGHIAESVAHDFNNLLTVIKGHVEMAYGITSDDSPIGAHLREIESAAARAAALTEQILTFQKRQSLRPQPLSFNQELEAMEKILKRLLGPQIALKSRTDPDLGLVLADPGQIDQLLVNVALLSRESMPGGGTLRIHTSRHSETTFDEQKEEKSVDFAVVQVFLDPEDSEAGPKSTKTEQSTGRNADASQDDTELEMLLRIVKQLGGVGRVTTGRGNGRVIAMRFPVLKREEAHSIPRGKPDPFRPLGILIIDDEVSILRLLERSLSNAGFKVFAADQPETAEEIFQANADQVDLLLSDVVMPRMSGMELYGRLLESRPDLKVLFISGYSRELVESAPGVPFLEKPFTPRKLVEMVKSVLLGESQ
jgi:CheY-like chemotaxis protein